MPAIAVLAPSTWPVVVLYIMPLQNIFNICIYCVLYQNITIDAKYRTIDRLVFAVSKIQQHNPPRYRQAPLISLLLLQ